MIEKIFDFIKDNLRNPKLYIFLLVVVCVVILIFPYIDANIFYYDRVEQRISILKEVATIDPDTLKDNPVLVSEYESIIAEIGRQKDGSVGSLFITQSSKEVQNIKFVTGASFTWLLAFCCLFIKNFKNFWNRLLGVIVFGSFGFGFGWIAKLMPTIINPVCNYILIPLLQVVLFGLLISSTGKNKGK